MSMTPDPVQGVAPNAPPHPLIASIRASTSHIDPDGIFEDHCRAFFNGHIPGSLLLELAAEAIGHLPMLFAWLKDSVLEEEKAGEEYLIRSYPEPTPGSSDLGYRIADVHLTPSSSKNRTFDAPVARNRATHPMNRKVKTRSHSKQRTSDLLLHAKKSLSVKDTTTLQRNTTDLLSGPQAAPELQSQSPPVWEIRWAQNVVFRPAQHTPACVEGLSLVVGHCVDCFAFPVFSRKLTADGSFGSICYQCSHKQQMDPDVVESHDSERACAKCSTRKIAALTENEKLEGGLEVVCKNCKQVEYKKKVRSRVEEQGGACVICATQEHKTWIKRRKMDGSPGWICGTCYGRERRSKKKAAGNSD